MRTVHKPAGLPVFPPHDDPQGDCVLARIDTDPSVAWPDGFDGGIAHRLDVSTSGALLVADDPDELARLRDAFRDRTFVKSYVFRAARDVPWHTHETSVRIAHHRRRKGRMVVERGRSTPHRGRWYEAHTAFRRRPGGIWEATMHSGVMHQIRAHAAFLGLPLLGDRRYGGGPTPDDAPPGLTFYLHHVGMAGPAGRTTPVPWPDWVPEEAR